MILIIHSLQDKTAIASFKQFKIYCLTKKLARKYSNEIIESLDQIPLIEKHTEEQLLSDFKSKRILYGKWDHSIIAIENDGIFAGVVIGSERKKEDNLWYSQNCVYINDFAVSPQFQKQGLGKFLIKTWINYNKSIGFLKLQGKLRFAAQTNGDKWNEHVHKIYESGGFKKFATKPYNNRIDNVYLLEI